MFAFGPFRPYLSWYTWNGRNTNVYCVHAVYLLILRSWRQCKCSHRPPLLLKTADLEDLESLVLYWHPLSVPSLWLLVDQLGHDFPSAPCSL